jgi:hypothetical protein
VERICAKNLRKVIPRSSSYSPSPQAGVDKITSQTGKLQGMLQGAKKFQAIHERQRKHLNQAIKLLGDSDGSFQLSQDQLEQIWKDQKPIFTWVKTTMKYMKEVRLFFMRYLYHYETFV